MDSTTTALNLIDQVVTWSNLSQQFVAVMFGAIGAGLLVVAGVFVARAIKKSKRGYRG